MSAESKPLAAAESDDRAAPSRAVRWWAAVERWLAWSGDRLNPILVKETRQALKSRQFVITFALLLLCTWGWSIIGMAVAGPEIYYGAQGPEIFYGYYLVLAFPLAIIVPFGAFRSLAAEREDRTYELLSISALGSRQMIAGKLTSAIVQMLVYLSAVSPCMAFTYLLRGIDFLTIGVLLFYTVLASVGLSLLALFLATLATQRHWQVLLTVLVVAGLLLAFWGVAAAVYVAVVEGEDIGLGDPEFWPVNAAIQTAYWSCFALVFFAAAAQLSFPSDNRATRLRIVMALQHALFAGWMAWVWLGPARGEEWVPLPYLLLCALYWYVMGALMTGESPMLSPRVKRGLPQSFLGRVFLTWFNPGPGTGYVFAVCGMTAAAALAAIGVAFRWSLGIEWRNRWGTDASTGIVVFGALALAYLTAYLGVGLLVLRALRKVLPISILTAALIHVLLLLAGWGLPWIVHLMSPLHRSDDYTLLHVTDPFWSPVHAIERQGLAPDAPALLVLVPLAALAVLLVNLPALAREVRQLRVERPRRVEEEDAEQAALRAPPQPTRRSPWDD